MFRTKLFGTLIVTLLIPFADAQTPMLDGVEDMHVRIGGYPEVLQLHDTKELDAMINFEAFIESGLLGAEVTMFDDGKSATQAFANGDLDGMFLTTVDYFAIAQYANPQHIYSLTWDGEPSQTYSLLVPKRARKIKDLLDLHGKELTLGIGTSLAALVLNAESQLLKQNSKKAKPLMLKRMRRVRNSETALVDLMFGKTDAVLVPTLAYQAMSKANPQTAKQLKQVFVSDPYVPGVFVLHQDLPAAVREQAVKSFVNMHNNEAGQHILELFQAKEVVRVDVQQLSNVRTLFAAR